MYVPERSNRQLDTRMLGALKDNQTYVTCLVLGMARKRAQLCCAYVQKLLDGDSSMCTHHGRTDNQLRTCMNRLPQNFYKAKVDC